MSINLNKGQGIDLGKDSLEKLGIGLGWDAKTTDTDADFDLDVSVFMLDANNKIPKERYFVFYNNLKSPDSSIIHYGDERSGKSEGDDETIEVNLTKVNTAIQQLVFVVTIHEFELRKQNFGNIENAFIRIYDWFTKKEIAKYNLDKDVSENTGFEFAKLYKKDEKWVFQAVGDGYEFGLQGFIDMYYKP